MSVFKVNPQNILGLDHSKFKSQLLAMALAEPHTYFRLRDDVYTKIVENAVRDAYNLYWHILKSGLTKVAANGTGGDQIKLKLKNTKIQMVLTNLFLPHNYQKVKLTLLL